MIKAAVFFAVLLNMGSFVSEASVDFSSLKDTFQSCQSLSHDMDDLVKQSIHADDRRFSLIG